jgi:DNA-binding NarL/FixJ family response regulator
VTLVSFPEGSAVILKSVSGSVGYPEVKRCSIRILVADDHPLVRQGICALVKSHPDWEICGEATDGRQAVQMVKELKPHIAILDIAMPNLNGLEATREILNDNPDQKVLILTVNDSEQLMREVLSAGARGFVLKSDAGRDLIKAVESLQRRGTFYTARVRDLLENYFAPFKVRPVLTDREQQVLRLIAEGKTTRQIAESLGCTVKTAETHRTNFMRKLNLHSVTEVVLYAIRNGIIHIDHLAA